MKLSSSGLRDLLWETMLDVKAGKIDAEQAAAVARLAEATTNSVKLDLQICRAEKNKLLKDTKIGQEVEKFATPTKKRTTKKKVVNKK